MIAVTFGGRRRRSPRSPAQRRRREREPERRAGEHVERDMLPRCHRRPCDEQAPAGIDDAQRGRGAQLAQQVVYPDRAEHRGRDVQRRARVAGGVDALQQREARVGGQVQPRRRHRGRGEVEAGEPGQAQPRGPEPVDDELAQREQQSGRDADVEPQRDVGRQRVGLEADPAVERDQRHRRHRVGRMAQHVEVADEEQRHERADAERLQHDMGAHALRQLDAPAGSGAVEALRGRLGRWARRHVGGAPRQGREAAGSAEVTIAPRGPRKAARPQGPLWTATGRRR